MQRGTTVQSTDRTTTAPRLPLPRPSTRDSRNNGSQNRKTDGERRNGCRGERQYRVLTAPRLHRACLSHDQSTRNSRNNGSQHRQTDGERRNGCRRERQYRVLNAPRLHRACLSHDQARGTYEKEFPNASDDMQVQSKS